jgi:bifunctional polynucleotide phosphatase/kinase
MLYFRKFAMNIGIAFHTPEEYFLGQEKEAFELGFDPKSSLATGTFTLHGCVGG